MTNLAKNKVTRSQMMNWLISKPCQLCQRKIELANTSKVSLGNSKILCEHCLRVLFDNATKNLTISTLGIPELKNMSTHIIAPFYHQNLILLMLNNFKYRYHLKQGRILIQSLVDSITEFYFFKPMPDFIFTIPSPQKRYQQKGWETTEFLAKTLARTFNIPLIKLLSRHGQPSQQAGLSKSARKKNVKNTIALKTDQLQRIVLSNSKTIRIALVEDVVTTGATAAEAIRTLTPFIDASSIDIWCLTIPILRKS